MGQDVDHFNQPVSEFVRKDVASLREHFTVQQALDFIRQRGVGEKIVYFYVLDEEERLKGVLPTRRLLTAPLEQRVADVMIRRVVKLPQSATVMDACEAFVLHKFLALPVVDDQSRIIGIVDVGLLTDEAFDLAERERMDAMFESIGVRVAQLREASPVQAFRLRFPWLLATITSGTFCAFLASAYQATLTHSIVLAFFITLVLGLAESVSIQSMTVTIQALRAVRPTFAWYTKAFRREAVTALMIGTGCGLIVWLIVWLWRGDLMSAVAIGGSISFALCAACFFGLTVPSLLHAFKLDPKIAAGPVTLALTDICALLFYFTLAAVLL